VLTRGRDPWPKSFRGQDIGEANKSGLFAVLALLVNLLEKDERAPCSVNEDGLFGIRNTKRNSYVRISSRGTNQKKPDFIDKEVKKRRTKEVRGNREGIPLS